MKAIYDASEGSEGNAVSGPQLLETLDLPDQELGDACRFLEGEGLIRGRKTLWSNLTPYTINITHRGIIEMEEALESPTKPTEYFPPVVSVVHVEGNVIGSPIQSGSLGAQQKTTVRDIGIEDTTEEALTSESKRANPWRLVLTIAVAGIGAAVTAVLGVSRLSWWSLAIVVFVAGAVLAAVTYAIAEKKHVTLALAISTGLCAALLIGIGLWVLIGPSPARTANVVANKVVTLSAEAGVSAAKEPSAIDPSTGQPYVFEPGSVNTATCYDMVGRSVWLYFHFSTSQNGWAPFSDFHYQNGLPAQLPSHC
jgi:membrane protein YqaA with SNARE-associated domain